MQPSGGANRPPTISIDQATSGPLQRPSTVSFPAPGGNVNIDLPRGINLKGVDTQAIGNSVAQRIQAAGGINKVPNNTVMHTFRGAAGVAYNAVVRNGKIVVERAKPGQGQTGTGTGAGTGAGAGSEGATTEPDVTTGQPGEAPTPPGEPGTTPAPQSAVDFAKEVIANNPLFGMPVANANATAEMKELVTKMGFSLSDENGQIIDPRLLFDESGRIVPERIAQYKLRLAPERPGGELGPELTAENYLGFQVNPEVGGTESRLLGTELGRAILEQKQRRADLLEQQSLGGATGGASQRALSNEATARALGFTDLVQGRFGGGLTDIAGRRQEALRDALNKVLENPEAYGYKPPTATAGGAGGAGGTGGTAGTPGAGGGNVPNVAKINNTNVGFPSGTRPPTPEDQKFLSTQLKNAKFTNGKSKPFVWRGVRYQYVKVTKNGKTTVTLARVKA